MNQAITKAILEYGARYREKLLLNSDLTREQLLEDC
jgi:hypothetical protein